MEIDRKEKKLKYLLRQPTLTWKQLKNEHKKIVKEWNIT